MSRPSFDQLQTALDIIKDREDGKPVKWQMIRRKGVIPMWFDAKPDDCPYEQVMDGWEIRTVEEATP